MNADLFVNRILDDEALTSDLDEPEAEYVVAWLIGRAKHVAATAANVAEGRSRLEEICHRARKIGQLVQLHGQDPKTATALARQEAIPWPPSATHPLAILKELLPA